MKIGIDARMMGVHFTGIGRYTYELIQNLATLDATNEYIIFLRRDAFDTFVPPSGRFKKVLADFPHYSWGEQIGFLKVIKSQKLDLMHFTHFNAPIFYRRPFVVTIHDLTLTFFPGKKMTGFLHRAAYHFVIGRVTKNSKKIIAISEHTKGDLINGLGVSADKIEVIHNGVSQEGEKTPTPRPEAMKKYRLERPYFLYTGVWRDHKNVVGMIQAFHLFNQKNGNHYDLVVTGKHNPAYREVPDTVSHLKMEAQVHLVGIVPEEDLLALYKGAIAYVFPSFYEGFGLPPLEAMRAGTPVIASNAASIPEVCGESALYFDPISVDDMAEKMRLIATDASLRQRLTDSGLERVKKFRWDDTANKVLQIYNSIGHGSPQ